MEYKGLTLDKFQEDAIKAIEHNKSVVVSAPTGSGKTLIADYIIDRDFKKGIKVIYTAPIKALSNQKYKEFKRSYGEENVGILTGDTQKNPDALILIMTTEIYRNMVLSNDPFIADISYVIFDEIHYINDIERGYVWEESIIFSKPKVRVLCLSATIPNAGEFARWIEAIKEHEVVVVTHSERPVPLHINFYDAELGITTLKNLKDHSEIPNYNKVMGKRIRQKHKSPSHIRLIKEMKDKIPCLFFSFSRAGCQKNALELARTNLFQLNPEISTFVRAKLANSNPEINKLDSTKALRQTLPYGIGFHHAGILPILKETVEDLFEMGLIKVLYTTETFAVGINMPAKSVCFESLRKFDGVSFRTMNSKEYFQIAGRAGRRGMDKEGFVFIMIERRFFEYDKTKKIIESDTTPIKSQFRLSVNTVLNLIDQHTPREIDDILCKSFHSFQKYGKDFMRRENFVGHNAFDNYKKKLEKLGYISNSRLTEKGKFASKIYSDEITLGEIFATDFYKKLNEYQMLVIVACICYEARERTEHYKIYHSDLIRNLKKMLWDDDFLRKEKKFDEIENITSVIYPCYTGVDMFKILEHISLQEGDVIRLFRQIMDKLSQIKSATDDGRLKEMLDSCYELVNNCVKDFDAV
ncbi:MAG TPA: DEAD/DEAH box helicase [Candidatus Nanoarchaeia archaeon]|nr:DEAD/DEAH box helicase [Candidatus Nanoarchaeia archaeon]